MPPGLQPIEPPGEAVRAFAVVEAGQRIGVVLLTLTRRPTGATMRRDWTAIPPADDPRPIPRPFDTRTAAVQTLRYRRATRPGAPVPATIVDATLRTIRAAYDSAGPNAAVWLAASLTVHHFRELDAHRQANPPALWREIRRVVDWLQAATGQELDGF